MTRERSKPVDANAFSDPTASAAGEQAISAARDSRLTEDLALALTAQRDLPPEALEALAKNAHVMKHRRVQMAVVTHPKTPRYVSLPIVRRLYTFELLRVSLMPSVVADLKMIAEETIISRLDGISTGERLSLAKQGTTRIAGALISDPEPRVMHAALQNSRLTEAALIKAITREDAPEHLIQAVCAHSKWSLGRDTQLALLRSEYTPLARAIIFAQSAPVLDVREVLRVSRLPQNVKTYLDQFLQKRS